MMPAPPLPTLPLSRFRLPAFVPSRPASPPHHPKSGAANASKHLNRRDMGARQVDRARALWVAKPVLMSANVEVGLLGPLEVVRGGVVVGVAAPKQRALLALLAL